MDFFIVRADFWHTSAGFIFSGSIFLLSLTHIFHKGIDDSLFDRIWHCAMAVIMLCSINAGIDFNSDASHVTPLILFLFWLRLSEDVVMKVINHLRSL